MPTFKITAPDGQAYNITAPEGATADQVLQYAQSQFAVSNAKQSVTPKPPPVNRSYQEGRQAPGALQGLASAINGPLMGFGDELLGAGQAAVDKLTGAPGSFSDRYTERRDTLRGMQDQQRTENPWMTGITQAMVSAPLSALSPARLLGIGANTVQKTGVIANSGRAAASGAGYGAVAGAGNSTAEDAGGVAADAGMGALTGAAVGGVVTPVVAGMGSAGRNVMQRISNTSAAAYAREKIAEALARDARGVTVASGASNPAMQVEARFNKLGPQAAVVDAGGRNTNQLLDTLATLPGRTKDAVSNFQRQRTAGAGERLRGAADNALGTNGQRLATTLDDLDLMRRQQAAPLYAEVRQMAVNADDELTAMVSAADKLGALGEARKMATAQRQQLTVDPANPGRWSMNDLDHIKRGLDSLVETNTNAVGKVTPVGRAIDQLRQDFVKKLDDLTTDPKTKQSVYKAARDAYAGPSQLMDAANLGRKAIAQDEVSISSAVRGMSTSELEAFRIGAFEGLRAKLGTQSGQTNILNMWKEPATQEKLKVIFGNERDFRQFASAAARESVLKRVQSVGQGSQTASRQAGMGDIDASAMTDAASAVANAKAGNVLGVLGGASRAWGRVATPQTVRDEMGRLLLLQGPRAQDTIQGMSGLVQQINRNNGLLADSLGLTGGLIGTNLAPTVPLGLLGR